MKSISNMRHSQLVITVIAALTVFLFLLFRLHTHGVFYSVPSDADETVFELIAFNIAEGDGFSGEVSDTFARPYIETFGPNYLTPLDGELDALGLKSTTTYRPPLFPALLGLLYRLFGRHFFLAKLLNIAFLSAGLGLLSAVALSRVGIFGVIVMVFGALIDPLFISYSRLGLSEASIFFFVSVIINLLDRKAGVISLGVALGVAGLSRTFVALWSFFIALSLKNVSLRNRILLVLIAISVLLPWAVRNSVVLGRFAPLGSQGGIVMGMIYGPDTVRDGGNWTAASHNKFVLEMKSYRPELTGSEREAAVSLYGQERGMNWIKDHISAVPYLMVRRVFSLWWEDTMRSQKLLIIFALFGLITLQGREIWKLCFPIIIAHSFAIAVTCNYPAQDAELHGRYLFVLHPFMLLCFGVSLVGFKDTLLSWRRS